MNGTSKSIPDNGQLATDNLDRALLQNVYENPTLGSTGSWYTSVPVTRLR